MHVEPQRPARSRRVAVLGIPLLILLPISCADADSSGDAEGRVTTSTIDATTVSSTSTTASPAVEVDQTPPVGANGIKVAEDGTLWIASVTSDLIVQVDPDTGRILQRIEVPDGSGPDDVVFAPDGTMYWTAYVSGDVGTIRPGSDETETVANVGPGANPLALREDGSLVVGRAGAATGLFTLDPRGDTTPVPLADPGNLNSFDIAPDGRLYAPSLGSASVLEIDADTGETVRTVAPVDGVPIALRWHDGEVYVLVLGDRARVVRVDPSDGTTELVADTGLAAADNLAVGEDGTVYVTGLSEPTITVLDTTGAVVRTITLGG